MKTRTLSQLMGAVVLATLAASPILAQECQPSARWGADDELGAANHVDSEQVLAAVQLVKKGETHPLGIVVDSTTPAFPPRTLAVQIVQPGQQAGQTLDSFGYPASYNDDIAQLWFGIGPQIDALSHYGMDNLYYNCNDAEDFAGITGVTKLGIENIPPLVGRGVLLDMAKYRGKDHLEGGESFNAEDVQTAAEQQGVEIREGDVVLFHTGWIEHVLESDPATFGSTEPGITVDAAEWLAEQNVMAVGADTWGLEAVPPAEGDGAFYGHVVLLRDNGIYILENMNTGRLAEEEVHEFMFTLGQARVRGAVQMIINPVAMW